MYIFVNFNCSIQGSDLIEKANGLHGFMNWRRNLLTVSVALLHESVRDYWGDR